MTWSKRTNIEEHQQFFSKINEIIGNLAPTVDEAEQAIAQATAAIASANDAVATANAASAAASAAASQAQTAASTVAGYDVRLTAAEGGIDALQAADAQNVKLTGEHAIGNYAVLLTGNQGPIAGVKSFANSIIYLESSAPTMRPGNDEKSTVPASELTHNMVLVQDDAGNNLAGIFSATGTDGKRHITAYVFDCDGNYRSQMIV